MELNKDENSAAGKSSSTSDMQEANATGSNQNEQGQASFKTGATTGGGSNYGQGSGHLGGEAYHQGDRTNSGSNYNDESGRLGSSSTGTSNEGASSSGAGAAASGNESNAQPVADAGTSARDGNSALSSRDDRGQGSEPCDTPQEGDRRDTGSGQAGHSDHDNTTAAHRAQSGSWSEGTADSDQ